MMVRISKLKPKIDKYRDHIDKLEECYRGSESEEEKFQLMQSIRFRDSHLSEMLLEVEILNKVLEEANDD